MSIPNIEAFRATLLNILSKYNSACSSGLYLPFEAYQNALNNILNAANGAVSRQQIGSSEQGRPIYELTIGNGEKTLFIWSQMHGNEATGTRALLNLLMAFVANKNDFKAVFEHMKLVIIPMVNPDGATIFTRRNARGIDLNRDARTCSCKETRILQERILFWNPQLALNLHDQRSIFGLKGSQRPAAMSFLNPSFNWRNEISGARTVGMRVIASITKEIEAAYPNSVGRYADEYYPTAFGEWVQERGIPCVLVEAGMLSGDLEKEIPVKLHQYVFVESMVALVFDLEGFPAQAAYFEIPEMHQKFFDLIAVKTRFTNVKTNVNCGLIASFALKEGVLIRGWLLQDYGDLQHMCSHLKVASIELAIEEADINSLIGKEVAHLINIIYE